MEEINRLHDIADDIGSTSWGYELASALHNIAAGIEEKVDEMRHVLAADGEPLEVGQTVWDVEDGKEFEVVNVNGELPLLKFGETAYTATEPEHLTHQRPVLDADGVPIKVGDMVWYRGHIDPLVVKSVTVCVNGLDYVTAYSDYEGKVSAPAGFFTHTKPEPDSWSSVWMDVSNGCETPQGMERRCRALAERGE